MGIKYILAVIGIISTLSPVSVAKVSAPLEEKAFQDKNQAVVKNEQEIPSQILNLWVTAYSSTPEETDDTPFITALGTKVRDGIIASNLLPFGTKVKIPELFGDKIFVVEDRMHRRKENFLDVWMPSKEAATEFGISYAEVIVL